MESEAAMEKRAEENSMEQLRPDRSRSAAQVSLATFSTPKGYILVETTPVSLPPEIAASLSRPPQGRQKSQPVARPLPLKPITEIGEVIDSITSEIVSRLSKVGPNEFTVELKVGIAGEANIPFLASAKSDAAVTITLKWTRPDTHQGDGATPK